MLPRRPSRRDEPVETAHLHLSSRVLQKVVDEAADRHPASVQIINRFAFRDLIIETARAFAREGAHVVVADIPIG